MYYRTYRTESFSRELLNRTRMLGLNPTIDEIMEYVKFLNLNFRIKNINLNISQEECCDSNSRGCYIHYKKEIRFYGEINLLTVLHELRHYIQFNSRIKHLFKTYNQREEEARGWSSSLFFALYPELYMELSEKGEIKFI